ncbi:MAG: hypothetical protein AAGJ87_15300 [Pseudomonadota bacterium]
MAAHGAHAVSDDDAKTLKTPAAFLIGTAFLIGVVLFSRMLV